MTINLEKSLNIDAPILDVYAVWEDAELRSQLLTGMGVLAIELTEQVPGQRLGWRVTGNDVVSTATVQFDVADNAHTKVTLTAHYPNGIGVDTSVPELTAHMENCLRNTGRILLGEDVMAEDEPSRETNRASLYPEVTESAKLLQQSMASLTQTWAASVNSAFGVISAFVWWPALKAESQPAQGLPGNFTAQ